MAGYQERLGLETRFIEGLRVTDEASFGCGRDGAERADEQAHRARAGRGGVRAAGISGVDDGTIYGEALVAPRGSGAAPATSRTWTPSLVTTLIEAGIVPVVSPISFGALDGLSYNVNADHAATALAARLGAIVDLVSNVPGVLVAGRVIRAVTANQAEQWIEEGIIFGGMIPKVRSAVEAVHNGWPRPSSPISPACRKAAAPASSAAVEGQNVFRRK
ncbi:MAG: acetylglutamate kinase [Caldilineaceae bacterium]|nr:acetylglutamate kinase [Caldilineaceae bacterium]